jgi:DNA-binding CsgD family transcriptional regulator
MTDGILTLSADDTITATADAAQAVLRDIGVVAGAYFLTPANAAPTGRRTVVVHFGFPEDVVAAYLDPNVFEHDPIPDHVMRRGRSMTWGQAIRDRDLTETEQGFIARFQALGMIDGVAIPLYGPHGRDSYSMFMFGRTITADDESLIRRVIDVAQFAHRKICAIVERDFRRPVTISKRESEVLYWMARGKSNSDVAAILGISGGTVDTFVRRLYAKLGVNDRVSAVVHGMSRGLFKTT